MYTVKLLSWGRFRHLQVLIVFSSIVTILGCSSVSNRPHIDTNQSYIENVTKDQLPLGNLMQVFKAVFESLPSEIIVYPTENYYYFRFFSNSREISGNFRLDPLTRDHGMVNFAYFSTINRPRQEVEFVDQYALLSERDGVIVKRESNLDYSVDYNNKRVRFHLNDLKQTPPSIRFLESHEKFVMRTMDESGFKFFLLFDSASGDFYFVLDETDQLPDTLVPLGKELYLGQRTGFVFLDDTALSRKVLIGVDADNVRRNNYYDGPFDQLADNAEIGNDFRLYLERAYPYVKGQINERGVFLEKDGQVKSTRVAITPYVAYPSLEVMAAVWLRCKKLKIGDRIRRCITHDPKRDYPGLDEVASSHKINKTRPAVRK